MECPHGYPAALKCPFCRRAAAAEAKEQGQAATLTAQPEWADKAWEAMLTLARTGKPFTADDLVAMVGMPEGSVNAIGAVFSRASKTNVINRIGHQAAERLASHLRMVGVWRGCRVEKDAEGEYLW